MTDGQKKAQAQQSLPDELRKASRIMSELDTLPTMQAIMSEAADEIEILRAQIADLEKDWRFWSNRACRLSEQIASLRALGDNHD